jgi:hypothetical protein
LGNDEEKGVPGQAAAGNKWRTGKGLRHDDHGSTSGVGVGETGRAGLSAGGDRCAGLAGVAADAWDHDPTPVCHKQEE